MHCWLADSDHHDNKKVKSIQQTFHLFFSSRETIFCFHRVHFTQGKISSDCMAAEVRPERAGIKSKVFFIWITKMPVNFTYGLAFHFAGCSAEIKLKGKSTQKGFQFKPVIPIPSLLRYHCCRTVITKGSSYPSHLQCCSWSTGRRPRAQVFPGKETANQRCWHVPRCGRLHAPCWWNPSLSDWYQRWLQLHLPETVILPFRSIFQIDTLRNGWELVSVYYMHTGSATEERGNIWSKRHLLILGRDVAAYHEVL